MITELSDRLINHGPQQSLSMLKTGGGSCLSAERFPQLELSSTQSNTCMEALCQAHARLSVQALSQAHAWLSFIFPHASYFHNHMLHISSHTFHISTTMLHISTTTYQRDMQGGASIGESWLEHKHVQAHNSATPPSSEVPCLKRLGTEALARAKHES